MDNRSESQIKKDVKTDIESLKKETNGTFVTELEAGEMKPKGTNIKFFDQIEKPKKKYTEEEMKMALHYQSLWDEVRTIEQIDKMLNELGTNE